MQQFVSSWHKKLMDDGLWVMDLGNREGFFICTGIVLEML
jgi:hypothetical protein